VLLSISGQGGQERPVILDVEKESIESWDIL